MTTTNRSFQTVGRAALLALAAGSLLTLVPAADAGPQQTRVVKGRADITRNGSVTTIKAGRRVILEHGSFDIGAGETVRFVQPGKRSRVLNRITGNSPTTIEGALLANGQVYIVNPAGVRFTASSVVDVGQLYAGAASLSNRDFLRGTMHFTNVTGSVVNEGLITADAVHLVAERVVNHGTIVADRGMVTMLAGDDVMVRERGSKIMVRVDGELVDGTVAPAAAPTGDVGGVQVAAVSNTGSIRARKGTIRLGAGDAYSLAVRNTGSIEAPGGDVVVASRSGTVVNEGSVDVSVARGAAGSVVVSGPLVVHEGEVRADAGRGRAGSATVTSWTGTMLGEGSVVSAAGGTRASGGEVLVHAYGGDTRMEPGSLVDISGGSKGGAGGFAEVSAARGLAIEGEVRGDVSPGASAASVLFDPTVIIVETPGAQDGEVADGEVNGGDPGLEFRISPGAIEGFAGDVTLEATSDVYISESIDKMNGGVTVLAGNDIFFAQDNGQPVLDLSIAADFVDLRAGNEIIDRAIFGTKLIARTGNINLLAVNGTADFGRATALTADRTVTITQAASRFIGAGPFGVIGNPEQTNLVVNITDGFLVFGGDFGGVTGFQNIGSVVSDSAQFTRIEDNLNLGSSGVFRSQGSILVDGYVRADTSIEMHAGQSGTGDLRFLSPGLDLAADAISLRAGSGTGTTAVADLRTNDPLFRGPAIGATSPFSFSYQQDAAIADAAIPNADQFGNGVGGMQYGIVSDGGDVTVATASKVAGSRLTIGGATGAEIADTLGLQSLRVLSGLMLNGDVTTTGEQTYDGDVLLGAGDRSLAASSAVFGAAVDGAEGLTIDADTTFGGAVGSTEALTSLTVNGPTTMGGGGVTTMGDQRYNGGVVLTADARTESLADGVLRFGGTVDGAFGLEAVTTEGGLIAFGGDVGSGTALTRVFLSTAGADGERPVPERATLVGEQDLTFTVGEFAMGQNEKMTVLGSLLIDASVSAKLGDLVTQGDMTISSPLIALLLRSPADLVTVDDGIVADRGLDFVSGGAVTFDGDVIFEGLDGAPPPTASSRTGDATGLPGSVELSETPTGFTSDSSLILDGQVLDQRTLASSPPPPPSGEPEELIDPLPRDLPFADTVIRGPYNVDMLITIGIAARGVDGLTTGLGNADLDNDMPRSIDAYNDQRVVQATRLDINAVVQMAALHEALFGTAEASRVPELGATLGDAVTAYLAETGATSIDPAAFAAFLETDPSQAEALAEMQNLKLLFEDLRRVGLTQPEYLQARRNVLAQVPDTGATLDQLGATAELLPDPPAEGEEPEVEAQAQRSPSVQPLGE